MNPKLLQCTHARLVSLMQIICQSRLMQQTRLDATNKNIGSFFMEEKR